MVIYMQHSAKKHFQSQKVNHWWKHMIKKNFAQKKLDHTAILLSFAVKLPSQTPSERIVLPVKKAIRKPILF